MWVSHCSIRRHPLLSLTSAKLLAYIPSSRPLTYYIPQGGLNFPMHRKTDFSYISRGGSPCDPCYPGYLYLHSSCCSLKRSLPRSPLSRDLRYFIHLIISRRSLQVPSAGKLIFAAPLSMLD